MTISFRSADLSKKKFINVDALEEFEIGKYFIIYERFMMCLFLFQYKKKSEKIIARLLERKIPWFHFSLSFIYFMNFIHLSYSHSYYFILIHIILFSFIYLIPIHIILFSFIYFISYEEMYLYKGTDSNSELESIE